MTKARYGKVHGSRCASLCSHNGGYQVSDTCPLPQWNVETQARVSLSPHASLLPCRGEIACSLRPELLTRLSILRVQQFSAATRVGDGFCHQLLRAALDRYFRTSSSVALWGDLLSNFSPRILSLTPAPSRQVICHLPLFGTAKPPKHVHWS